MPKGRTATVEDLIRRRMATGRYGSEEDLLIEALESLDEFDEEVQAIEEGLASVDRGEEGLTVKEAFALLRKKYPAQD